MEETRMVVLETAEKEDMGEFIEKLQEAFAVGQWRENLRDHGRGPHTGDEEYLESVK